jgi:hypothetical protein
VTELQGLQLAATPLLLPQLAAPLQGLHLDWCKVEAATLQPHLLATLRCCSSLRSLSLIGYQGDIEEVGDLGCSSGSAVDCRAFD